MAGTSRGVEEWAALIPLRSAPVACLIRRSPRARHLRLTIDPLVGAIVTVPARLARSRSGAERVAHEFVAEREVWLRRHLDRRERRLAAVSAAGPLGDGARLRFRGEEHRLRVTGAASPRRSSVSRYGAEDCDELVVSVAPSERRPLEAILEAWFRERARTAIQREIERHAPDMAVQVRGVTIRDQKTRWGSCSREARLSFSWRLILAPPEVLETVVVHELAHIRVFGHGPRFWAVVGSRMPDHRRWRRWLRDHSFELHAALEHPSAL